MAGASTPMHTARDLLAEARERFLAAEPVDPNAVRKPILASWWRSRQWHVAADHIELDYLHDPDLESNLARTATSSGSWTASSWPPASATPRLASAPTASAPHWNPAARPMSSGMSTTP